MPLPPLRLRQCLRVYRVFVDTGEMAVNFALVKRPAVDPLTDPMGRSWVGWDRTKGDEQLWENNRGVWRLGDERLARERLATMSHDGIIQLVAEITGHEVVQTVQGIKKALLGTVLAPGDPVRDALVGRHAPSQRNPVGYLDTSELENMSPSERAMATATRSRRAFLANNNPARWAWEAADYEDAVRVSSEGRIVRGRWSTGQRVSGLEPGDRVYLLRQGDGPRGIMGSGTFVSRPFSHDHWDEERPGEQANFALVDWEVLLPIDNVLPLEVLQGDFPDQHWTPQASGTELRQDVLDRLEVLWTQHVGHPVPPRGARRQGWQMSPERRKKVEDAAQDRLMQHFRDLGWHVADTRFGHPYDAVAVKDGQVRYLEAKGTETQGHSVIVTRNEVQHARAHPGQCVMGILSEISWDPSGEVVPGSGRFRVLEWQAQEATLEPRDYDFRPAE